MHFKGVETGGSGLAVLSYGNALPKAFGVPSSFVYVLFTARKEPVCSMYCTQQNTLVLLKPNL